MEKLYNLINEIKEIILPTMKKEINELKSNMSDPKTINNKANKIKEYETRLGLLKDFTYLAEENNNDIDKAKKIMKESLRDLKKDTMDSPDRNEILKQASDDKRLIKSIATFAKTEQVLVPSNRQNTEDVVQTDYSFLDDID